MQCVDRISIYLCVSVCVSVTLSVNSLTGQIPQRIFTVDSLKDADLRKDVPFWGLDDEQSSGSNIRVQSLPKPSFWGPNRHFKPNMRKIQIAVSSNLCVRLTWNLTGSCGQQQRLCGWSRMLVKQLQDGRRPPFWKSLYRHISAINHPISMKFCTQQQILNWWTSRDQFQKAVVQLILSSNWHAHCDLPFSRYSFLITKFWILGILWVTAPKRRQDPSGTHIYRHAKFHPDRCHCCLSANKCESWEVNRHIAWCTNPYHVVSQCSLMPGCRVGLRRSAPTYGKR